MRSSLGTGWSLPTGAILGIALSIAVFAGVLAAVGAVIPILGLAGALVGLGLMLAQRVLFLVTVLFALIVSGLAEFYLGIGQANWVASGLALALGGAALLAIPRTRVRVGSQHQASVMPLVLAYLAFLVLASIVNGISLTQLVVGLRNYVPFVGVLLACRYVADEALMRRIPFVIVLIGFLQLPFALHQALFVAPLRQYSLTAVGGGAESIVGTFGGDPFGGGYTGEMAVFVLFASCIALAVPAAGAAQRWIFRFMPIFAVWCVALAETKIVFVLAPFVVALVFLEEARRSPIRFISILLACAALLGALAVVYSVKYWSAADREFLHAFTYSFDPNFMVDSYHRGRVGALVHWWDQNVMKLDPLRALVGYGVASTLEASRVLGEGNAVRMFGLGLDAHAANKLLWDAGLLGLGLFCWVIGRTAWSAHKLVSVQALSDVEVGMLRVARGAMFAFAVMLPYQVAMVGGAPMQLLFWLLVGYVEYCRRKLDSVVREQSA